MTGDHPHDEPGPDEPRSPDDERVAGVAEDPGREAEDAETLVALAEMTAERDEYLDALRRLQAEFENFRKRTMRQQTDLLGRASEGVVERLFPVLDALDLALAHVGEEEVTAEHLQSALGQINALLRDTLASEGLERIDASDVLFDPTIHDAVAHIPRERLEGTDTENGTDTEDGVRVFEVMRAGYRLKGRVLRPAMVMVKG